MNVRTNFQDPVFLAAPVISEDDPLGFCCGPDTACSIMCRSDCEAQSFEFESVTYYYSFTPYFHSAAPTSCAQYPTGLGGCGGCVLGGPPNNNTATGVAGYWCSFCTRNSSSGWIFIDDSSAGDWDNNVTVGDFVHLTSDGTTDDDMCAKAEHSSVGPSGGFNYLGTDTYTLTNSTLYASCAACETANSGGGTMTGYNCTRCDDSSSIYIHDSSLSMTVGDYALATETAGGFCVEIIEEASGSSTAEVFDGGGFTDCSECEMMIP